MIAREQKLASVKQYCVTASVARNGNREQIIIELHRFASAYHTFDTKSGGAVIRMHHALTGELLGEPRMVCDIVLMRQKQRADAAHRFDPFDELRGESRRINQHVAAFIFRADDQVTPRAKA